MHHTCLFVLYRYIYSTYIIKYLFLDGLYLEFVYQIQIITLTCFFFLNLGILITFNGETLKLVETPANYTQLFPSPFQNYR